MLQQSQPYQRLIVSILLWIGLLAYITSCTNTPNSKQLSAAELTFDKNHRIIDSFISTYQNDKVIAFLDTLPNNLPENKYLRYYHWLNYYRGTENFDSLRLYADSAVAIVAQLQHFNNYKSLLSDAYAKLGEAELGLLQYEAAGNSFFKAKKIAFERNDTCAASRYTYRLGMACYRQGNYTLAAQNFQQAFAEAAHCDGNSYTHYYKRQELLNNIALSYSKRNQHDSALHYYKKAIEFIEAGESKFPKLIQKLGVAKAVIYGNMASSLLIVGDTATAEQHLLQSYQTNNAPLGEQADAQYSALKLINVYLAQQRWNECKALLTSVGAYMDTTKNVPDRIKIFWNRSMARLYQQGLKNFTLASTYYSQYDSIKLRFDSTQANITQNDITLQLKHLEKQYELRNLLKEQQQQQRINTIAWSLVVITIITLSIILWLLQKSRRHVQALKDLNTTIEQQKQALNSALKKAENEAADKDKIVRVVAHDLRNPLAAMSSLSNLIIDNPAAFNDGLEPIRMIKASCDSSLDLINDLLESADFQQQKVINKAPVSLQDLLKHAVEMMRFKANEKQQQLALQLPATPTIVLVNKEKIWRVLANLIANAIKFSQHRSVIEIGATVNDNGTLIYVKDDGVGIPAHLQPYVFDAFTTAKRKGTQGEPTFGLGLSICKQIMDAHGGSIYFESEELVGTCFYIHLPQGS